MRGVINKVFATLALLIIGYYLGSFFPASKNSSKSDVKKDEVSLLNKVESKEKLVISHDTIESSEQIVYFEIAVIMASTNETGVSTELTEIKKSFDSITNFSEFKLIKTEKVEVKISDQKKIILPNNQFLYFTPKKIEGDELSLNLRIPWILNINLGVKNNESFFQGGLRYKDRFIILHIKPSF
ncbi:hypothetical protein JXR93_07625 [bacterium]|nr:hypothetical protein [bacterium]